jgi:hypothetical protein
MKFFLQLVISCVLIAYAHASDGWEKVKWGMTMEQVREIYPKAIRPDLPSDLQSMDFVIAPSKTLEMTTHEWQGLTFSVTFVFDESKRLDACLLHSSHDRKNPNLNLAPQYERVVKTLSATYGKAEEEKRPDSLFKMAQWTRGETEIKCMLIFGDDPMRTAIIMSYKRL